MNSWCWDFVESMDSVDWNEQDGGVVEFFGVVVVFVDAVKLFGVVSVVGDELFGVVSIFCSKKPNF
jgi:hypothetical protein